jgi:diacylglycerol O-acyltransferase-1
MKTETSTSMATSTSFEDSKVNGVTTNRAPVSPSHDPHATATATATATALAHETTTTTPSDTLANGSANGIVNGTADGSVDVLALRKAFRNKYRHVEAVHSESKPSCLSHDTTETPSFIGFRNLMVIVLVAANLRLVIENIQKVGIHYLPSFPSFLTG